MPGENTLPEYNQPPRNIGVTRIRRGRGTGNLNSRDPEHPSTREPSGERRLVDPLRCRIWTQHSRPEERLTDEACKGLRDSIEKNGQHQPALGRPANDEPGCDVEIICGARRYSVARALGKPLLVELRNLTDAEAYVAMYEENLLREGDSPYVRGQILLRALRTGTYTTQDDLCRAFNLSHSSVSRLLTVAQLPSVIVGAFRTPDDIKEAWGVTLQKIWSDTTVRPALAEKARSLANRRIRLCSRDTFDALRSPPGGRWAPRMTYRNVPVRGTSGTVLFHEQEQLTRIAFFIPKPDLSPTRLEALKRSLVHILESPSNAQAE